MPQGQHTPPEQNDKPEHDCGWLPQESCGMTVLYATVLPEAQASTKLK